MTSLAKKFWDKRQGATMNERDQINERIAEWLGLCWHEFRVKPLPVLGVPTCIHCGETTSRISLEHSDQNPDFSTFPGMEILLAGLRLKGWNVKLFSHSTDPQSASIFVPTDKYKTSFAKADTLPDALCEATLKLIESEANDAGSEN
jgi:hypothetical protein